MISLVVSSPWPTNFVSTLSPSHVGSSNIFPSFPSVTVQRKSCHSGILRVNNVATSVQSEEGEKITLTQLESSTGRLEEGLGQTITHEHLETDKNSAVADHGLYEVNGFTEGIGSEVNLAELADAVESRTNGSARHGGAADLEGEDNASFADRHDQSVATEAGVADATDEGGEGNGEGQEALDSPGASDGLTPADIAREVARRRNFAIISHPDAGKTTLTEKLLLYGGAIHEAGTVKARRAARHATSDWMELEKQRGISITSTAMVFETQGKQITLLDTPGHQDFGEDTYRTLAAADNAVMLVDAGKGLEPQTRKLFEVCRMRKLPIFTFMNKMDRPAMEPLELLDQIEKEFNLATYAVNWPIGSGDRFKGVVDRPRGEVHLFEKDASHGRKETVSIVLKWGDPKLKELIDADLYEQLVEEVEMLDELTPPLDLDRVHRGELTLVYFGSAFNNFAVELFLESFLECSIPPGQHESDAGDVDPDYPHFTGFVFKLQANMDPKHRDKVAFVRVCSGQFQKGMKVNLARTGKTVALTRPQKMFAQERSVVETGFAGDVIGLNNPNTFAIGDTIFVGPRRIFPGIPMFSPELFALLRNPNPSKYKQFLKGLTELLGEGAVQVLYSVEDRRNDPILAAVGQLQFEVVQYRMQAEYGVETILEPLGFSVARWVEKGWPALEQAGRLFSCQTVKDQWGRPVLLFRNEWNVGQVLGDHPEIGPLLPYSLPPLEVASTSRR
eukprot:TRINITY_DN29492_c0_g1_i1.p1 TRINITY_DN29492_c0_g1~~TRINITY_DN29492_c0_g1_i1.p1  ORF type:complete len:758 (+),score=125.02 TRINITY_DN29492_c0_g1_i1:81-2276(+)